MGTKGSNSAGSALEATAPNHGSLRWHESCWDNAAMTRTRWHIFGVGSLFALVASGCGVGAVGDGGGGGDGSGNGDGTGGGDGIPGLLCTAELSVTGTLTPSPDAPPDDGCVPNGTWEVSLALEDMGECDDVTYDASYTYEVTGSPAEGGYTVTYVEDPENPNVYLKVKGQGGACEGSFEHWSADGKTLLLIKPYEEDLTIGGSAYFEVYSESQL